MPFTTEQFFGVFKDYNETYYPLQFIIWLISMLVLCLTLLNHKNSNKLLCGWLAFLWSWMGIVYHIGFFSVINQAAYLFGALFIVQSILFILYGVFKNKLTFKFRPHVRGITGM